MIKQLKSQGVPIHEIGFQTHESVHYMDTNWFISMKENMKRFKSIGLTSNISELDIRCDTFPGSLTEKYNKQAECYYNLFKYALSDLSICKEITLWQFTGKYTWIYSFFSVNSMYCPCPWDNDLTPMPALQSIKQALKEIVKANALPTPVPTPVPTQPPLMPVMMPWTGQGCSIETVYKTVKRTNKWSGPIIPLLPNKRCRLVTFVNSSKPVTVTMKYSNDNTNYTYTNLIVNVNGNIDLTFPTPNATNVFVYVEGPDANINYSVTAAKLYYL